MVLPATLDPSAPLDDSYVKKLTIRGMLNLFPQMLALVLFMSAS